MNFECPWESGGVVKYPFWGNSNSYRGLYSKIVQCAVHIGHELMKIDSPFNQQHTGFILSNKSVSLNLNYRNKCTLIL